MGLKNNKTKAAGLGLILLIMAAAFSGPGDRYFEIAKNLDIFTTLYKEVNALYVDEVNPNEAMRAAIDAMLASLDPYTNYIPEDDIEDFRTQSTGLYGGIGAVTSQLNGKTLIIMLMEGYSAEKNGLRIGDEIVKVNNVDVGGMSREEISDLMKGQANTLVSLTVRRYGHTEPLTIKLKREKVRINNVPYYGLVKPDIGYIKLTEFTMQASDEVEAALIQLKKQGAKKVILDVRNNPGGLLLEAVNTLNLFLPKGTAIVSTKGKIPEHNATYKTLDNSVDEIIPLVVLINSGSASAAEIVAGTVQDYDRGVIIGERSYGKGLVQITRPLSYNAQLKVTTAKYHTPSGRCIQAVDYSFRNPDGSVGKIPDSLKTEFRTANGRIVFDGGGIDPDIIVDKEPLSAVGYSLFTKGLIFDYATKYYYEHPKISNPTNFKISNTEYTAFKEWLRDKDYSYATEVEKSLKELRKNAEEEKYYDAIEEYLRLTEQKIAQTKENDLEAFSRQIKSMLEDEIISRYYLERGSIEATFDSDRDILEAVAVLNNQQEYNDILKAPGQ